MVSERRRVVALAASLDRGRLRPGRDLSVLPCAYSRAIVEAGATPILALPGGSAADVAEICEALVLTGGDDIPALDWGGEQHPAATLEDRERLRWDRDLLAAFLAAGKPVLGICYGMQLLNVAFGGSLVQELVEEVGGDVDHGGAGRVVEHDVSIEGGCYLRDALGGAVAVRSSHHQAVAKVGHGLRVTARSPDGVVEAVEGEGVLGVEWHPELDATSLGVYRFLLGSRRR